MRLTFFLVGERTALNFGYLSDYATGRCLGIITPTNVTKESRRCDDATQLVLGVVQSLSPAQTPGGERSGIVDAYCLRHVPGHVRSAFESKACLEFWLLGRCFGRRRVMQHESGRRLTGAGNTALCHGHRGCDRFICPMYGMHERKGKRGRHQRKNSFFYIGNQRRDNDPALYLFVVEN
jgi:hypothetical protein